MHLRELRVDDAPLMIEWMHDESVVGNLRGNFASKTIEDCVDFINSAISDSHVHLAIASDEDEYMGKLKEYISSTVESAKRSNNQAKLSGFYSRVKGYYKGGSKK